jgi:hypothetical protein
VTSRGNIHARSAPTDSDEDGQADFVDYEAGSDPLDPESSFAGSAVSVENGSIHIEWQSTYGGIYRLQWKDSLTATNWNDVAGPIPLVGGLATYIETAPRAQRYYRLILTKPE